MDRRRFVPSTEGLEGRQLLATSLFGTTKPNSNPDASVPFTYFVKEHRIERLVRIDHAKSYRCACSARTIRRAYAFEESHAFHLDAIDRPARARAREALADRQIEQQGQIGFKAARSPAFEFRDALNWLTAQTSGLAYTAFAPKGTRADALAALRAGFDSAASDGEFIAKATTTNGVPYTFVDVEHGRATVRSLAEVSPGVVRSLRQSMSVQN